MSDVPEAPPKTGGAAGSAARELQEASRALNIQEGEPAAIVFKGFTSVCEALDETAQRVTEAATIKHTDIEKALRTVAARVLPQVAQTARDSRTTRDKAMLAGIVAVTVLTSFLAGMLTQSLRGGGLEERLGTTCLRAATAQQGGGVACSIWISPPPGR